MNSNGLQILLTIYDCFTAVEIFTLSTIFKKILFLITLIKNIRKITINNYIIFINTIKINEKIKMVHKVNFWYGFFEKTMY